MNELKWNELLCHRSTECSSLAVRKSCFFQLLYDSTVLIMVFSSRIVLFYKNCSGMSWASQRRVQGAFICPLDFQICVILYQSPQCSKDWFCHVWRVFLAILFFLMNLSSCFKIDSNTSFVLLVTCVLLHAELFNFLPSSKKKCFTERFQSVFCCQRFTVSLLKHISLKKMFFCKNRKCWQVHHNVLFFFF